MKFFTIVALLAAITLVSAAPCVNSNHEDNSKNANKEIVQSVGAVGNGRHGNSGLLTGLLGSGLLSTTTNNNYINQNANIN
ncbi:uncharacterized protein BX663DRAFT_563589 [Cokeromyces recurvatus]|uniref:uncharacterized protein n=1 Tax=Cokeromyces recurvatus TaxID=90255 RepID=UPI00221F3FA4|nr:uncharacterized protein BX663DRAFT_563589 [Cokeromyces recurvatus]KAI7899884.1 hypothetical protein BX663DRAFT_563589 [Cokeromyces recurvatus]